MHTPSQITCAPTSARHFSVYYCGPIASPGKPARGGYEAANRRLVDLLSHAGLSVSSLPYFQHFAHPILAAPLRALGFFYIAQKLARHDHDPYPVRIFHLTPLYHRYLPFELALTRYAVRLRYLPVIDIRAGTFHYYYQNGSPQYRRSVRSLLTLARRVFTEGREYCPFLESITGRAPFYLPNFTEVDQAAVLNAAEARNLSLAKNDVRLIYFGRLVKEKGVDVVLETAELLRGAGINAILTLIGAGPSSYIQILQQRASKAPHVRIVGSLPPSLLRQELLQNHFFLFPTIHRGEGHSNALTEAMAYGLVPICTSNGFNASVVSRSGIILPLDATPHLFATSIQQILSSHSWDALSRQATQRIQTTFSPQVTIPNLIREYAQLANSPQPAGPT